MKLHPSLKAIVSAAVFAAITLSLPSLTEARGHHRKPAAKHSIKKKKSAKKHGKKKAKKSALHKRKHGKRAKIAKAYSNRLPKGVIPPSRVRIIDTAGKGNPDAFPMPDLKDVRDVATTAKKAESPEPQLNDGLDFPEMPVDAFSDSEAQ